MTGEEHTETPYYLTFKGGRLTKYKGVVASLAPYALAPSLALPMAFALSFGGASLMGTTALHAQSASVCTLTAPDVFECSGPTTATQTLTGADSLTVTTTPGFSTNTSGTSFFLETLGTSTGALIFDDQNASSITAGGRGLFVAQRGQGALAITTTGVINAGDSGLYVYNDGTQAAVIDAQGDITAGRYGVRAFGGSTSTDLTITTTNVSTGLVGIDAAQFGTGDLNISSTGTLTVAPPSGTPNLTYGVFTYVSSASRSTTIGVNTVNVTSGGGIYAYSNSSSGTLTITGSGAITTTRDPNVTASVQSNRDNSNRSYGAGIFARSYGSGGTQISVATVNAFGDGVYANNDKGALKITASGDITGGKETFYGTGRYFGYYTSRRRDGIEAYNRGTDLIIDVQGVSGTDDGIEASNIGSGLLRITTSGPVVGGSNAPNVFSANGNGIEAFNLGTDLIIDAKGSVTGNDEGIDADNRGSGSLYITASGPVAGGIAPNPRMTSGLLSTNVGGGIYARNLGRGVNLRIEAVDVSGYGTGIYAENFGTGSTYISSTGTVIGGKSPYPNALSPAGVKVQVLGDRPTANRADGIHVSSGSNTTGLTVKGNNVYGGRDGIFAEHDGSGALSITTTGKVSGGPGGPGYFGFGTLGSAPAGVSVPGSSETVRLASHFIGGYYSGVGINAVNGSNGTDLTINAVDVSGYGDAINATNYGTGMLSITTTGTVVGGKRTTAVGVLPARVNYAPYSTVGHGIYAKLGAQGTSLSVTTGAVTGAYIGIGASSRGTGDLKIESKGDVYGGDTGIGVLHSGQGAVQITSGKVSGGYYGIYARNGGTGAISVTADTASAAAYGSGIAVNHEGTGDITITAKDTTGGTRGDGDEYGSVGILARHSGTGNTTITSTGTATGGVVGIGALTQGNVYITSNIAKGERIAGIYVGLMGTGNVQITTTGATTGTNGPGIIVRSESQSSKTTVDIAGQVTGGNGRAIDLESVGGEAKLVLRDGFGLTGQALTKTGDTDDTLELAGASPSPSVRRSSGSPTLDLASIGATGNANGIIGFENFDVSGGSWALTGTQTAGAFNSATIQSGATATLDSATLLMGSAPFNVLSGGTLGVNGASTLTGSLLLGGSLNMQDGAAGDTLAVSGNLVGAGSVALDVDFLADTADQLNISGDTSGETALSLNGVNPNFADGSDITLVTVGGSTGAENFVLTGGQLDFGVFAYELALERAATSDFKLRGKGLNGTGVAYQNALNVLLGGTVSVTDLLSMLKDLNRSRGLSTRDALTFSSKGEGSAQERLVWARSFGHWENGDSSGSGNAFSFENNAAGVQVGLRALSQELGNGTLTVDLFTEAKQVSGSASNSNGTGSSDGKAFGIGAAALWENGSGFYLGALAQASHVKSDISSSNGGRLVTGHTSVAQSFVVEGGYTFDIASNVSLTPSAGLAYSHLTGGRFTDTAGNVVDLGSKDTLTGTIGAELGTVLGNGTELHAAGYVTHDLSGALTATAGAVTLNGGEAPTMFELSAGAEIPLGDATDIFVDGAYGRSFENGADKRETYSVSFGIKATW